VAKVPSTLCSYRESGGKITTWNRFGIINLALKKVLRWCKLHVTAQLERRGVLGERQIVFANCLILLSGLWVGKCVGFRDFGWFRELVLGTLCSCVHWREFRISLTYPKFEWCRCPVLVASEVTTDRFAARGVARFTVRSFRGGMLVCCFALRNGILWIICAVPIEWRVNPNNFDLDFAVSLDLSAHERMFVVQNVWICVHEVVSCAQFPHCELKLSGYVQIGFSRTVN
jgi:hypothetical protein